MIRETIKNWKLKLRYGLLKTPYSHYTLIADGKLVAPPGDDNCPAITAFMGMKVWASSEDEAFDMIRAIGRHHDFIIEGRIYLYTTDPVEPPREHPYGYDINFKPYQ